MDKTFFEHCFEQMKMKYSFYKSYQDYHLFTLLCMKYYFFSEDGNSVDPEAALDWLTDGSNDGGIDAIFNDPTSEGNDVIIVQSKYYKNTDLHVDDIVSELFKISTTLKRLQNNRISEFSEILVTAYKNASSQMEDSGVHRIYFFTSYQTKSKKERNKIDKALKTHFSDLDVELQFATDIETTIDLCDNGKLCVEYDKLEMDEKDNYLVYEDSVIVNISALSLQDLQNRRRNGLLGMNLRYYTKQKNVDEGIKTTIQNDYENFWYKNNGILIVCDDYEFDGKVIKLFNFSIVNGGQTTNRIGNYDIEHDFYLQCKIVKSKGKNQSEKDKFVHDIAEAANAQKPIKDADLKSNSPEQLRLKERLNMQGVYYVTKKGEKAPKYYNSSYCVTSLEKVGKLSLSACLQMPGSARSNSKKMYTKECYYSIFGEDAREGVIADCLKILYYYDQFIKKHLKDKGYDEKTDLPCFKNGKMHHLACIVFLCKIINEVFTYDEINKLKSNTNDLKLRIKQMGDMKSIIKNKLDNEQEIFFEIFSKIGTEVIGHCYNDALEKAEEEQKTIAASDFLKSDLTYYKVILKRLWGMYNRTDLKKLFELLCVKK